MRTVAVEEPAPACDGTDPPDAKVEDESDDDVVEDTIPPDAKDKFDISGGTFDTATVGVVGVLASDFTAVLISLSGLLLILASGIFATGSAVFALDCEGENLLRFCIKGGASVLMLARDGGEDPLDDGEGVGGDLV